MPIQVTCECGQKVAVKEEFVGRRVKCPKCKNPLVVSAGDKVQGGSSTDQTPIRVACSCGKSFSAPRKLAGKAVKCPACGQPMKIPQVGASSTRPAAAGSGTNGIDDLLDEIGVKASTTGIRCPECRADMKQDAIICINCGYNTETGKKLKTVKFVPPQKREKKRGLFGVLKRKRR